MISISIFSLVLLINNKFSDTILTVSRENAQNTAYRYANLVSSRLNKVTDKTRVIAQLMENCESISVLKRRHYYNNMLKSVIEKDSQYLAVWTVIEPNAMDNRDAQCINKEGSNGTGRYAIGWYRKNKNIDETIADEKEILTADYYQLPKKYNNDIVSEPYFYSYKAGAEEKILTASFIVPIRKNNKFIGVVGVDLRMDEFRKMVKDIVPFGNGNITLLCDKGIVVADRNRNMIGEEFKDIKDKEKFSSIMKILKENRAYSENNEEIGQKKYSIIVPIFIGNYHSPWAIAVSIDEDYISSPANQVQRYLIFISFITIPVIIIVVYFDVKRNLLTINNESLKNRYKLLTSQLDSHFLFNSLNTLSYLIDENKSKASNYIYLLSQVYRYVLNNIEKEVIGIKEELDFLDKYINLLNERHEDGLIVTIDYDYKNKEKLFIFPLSLQILLENVVKHNVVDNEKKLYVNIIIKNNSVVFTNNVRKKQFQQSSTGVGLKNLISKYEYYNKTIDIIETEDIFTVTIPLIGKEEKSFYENSYNRG